VATHISKAQIGCPDNYDVFTAPKGGLLATQQEQQQQQQQ
jgi:hypothetical protein